jgi:hypothetical protein
MADLNPRNIKVRINELLVELSETESELGPISKRLCDLRQVNKIRNNANFLPGAALIEG